jgi:Mg-chelatase subunit ChlD
MRLSRTAWPVFGGSCLVLLLAAACGSSAGSNVNGKGDGDGSSAGTSTGNGKAGKSGTSGPILGGLGGDATTSTGGTTGAVGPECAGDLIQAERIPLDIYVMLDQSGSMLEATVGNAKVTKWDAVSSALTDFVSDKASDGIGMGLQLFPIQSSLAPASCKTNPDCNHFGYCFLKACWGYDDGLIPCDSAVNCVIGGTSYGPCQAFGSCSANADFVCPTTNLGKACGIDPATNKDLGTCQALASSTCTVTDDCRSATYAAPAAPIAPLPGAKAALVGVLQKAVPDGFTPTQPALTGAIDQATEWAKAHTDHQVVAVLATDGIPTLKAAGNYCASITDTSSTADVNAVLGVASNGQKGTPKISTFVIGVVGPNDTGAPAILDAIANSGGTNKAFIVSTAGNVQTEFRAALNAIRSAGLSCDLLVPQAEAGKTVDYLKVNVAYDNGSGPTDLGYVETAANCDATAGGWYYDVEPSAGKRIQTCPATCTAFQKTDMGSVQIKLGCVTHDVVK